MINERQARNRLHRPNGRISRACCPNGHCLVPPAAYGISTCSQGTLPVFGGIGARVGLWLGAPRVLSEVQAIASHAKLPLVDLAMPGLRHLSLGQFQHFRGGVQKLVESDGEVDLFENLLRKIALCHLEPHLVPARKPRGSRDDPFVLVRDSLTEKTGIVHL